MPIYIALPGQTASTASIKEDFGVTPAVAARYLGISVRHLHRLDTAGLLLPSWRTPGGHRRYAMQELRRYRELLIQLPR